MVDDLDGVFDSVRTFLARRYPGDSLDDMVLNLRSGKRIVLPASMRCLYVNGEAPVRRRTITHSADYRTLNYFGHVYNFTVTQAPVIRELLEARANDVPVVSMATLLEAADSTCARLHDLFKRSPAWGTLIVPDGAGMYRLATRDELDSLIVDDSDDTD